MVLPGRVLQKVMALISDANWLFVPHTVRKLVGKKYG